ncbi:hypothetical protein BDF19DRAFT_438869 [Syncephalis fuscata]|nr:hypothetical protein BDF19DRAFT_438869 [Syncephalis fuscata]
MLLFNAMIANSVVFHGDLLLYISPFLPKPNTSEYKFFRLLRAAIHVSTAANRYQSTLNCIYYRYTHQYANTRYRNNKII